jgi:hypothetical protein
MYKTIISIIAIISITSITAQAGFFDNRTGAVQEERDASGRNASATYYQRLHHTQEEVEDNILKARRACTSEYQTVDRRTGQALPNSGYAFQYQQQCLDQAGGSIGMKLDMSGGGTVNNGGIQNGVIQRYRLISYMFHNEKGQQVHISKNDRESFMIKMGTEASSSGFASFILYKGGMGIVNDLRIPIVSTGRNMPMIQQILNVNTLPKMAEQFYNDVVSKRGMAFHYYMGELLVNPDIRNEFMDYLASLSPAKPAVKQDVKKKYSKK